MLISVFTPTYNRADLIHRVFDSLNAQTFTDFEWIVLDDGSTDETADVLEDFRQRARYPVKVHRRENRGKAQSINDGLDLAKGELFICFDSDDWCTPDALARIAEVWNALSTGERKASAGISCLKRLQDGSLVGEDYARMGPRGETYVDRFNRRIAGDKWEIIRTDLHKAARYDLAANERYMAPEYAWLKIGTTHTTIFLNEALSVVEYQAEGISRNNLAHRAASPVSTARFYRLAWSVARGAGNRLRAAVNHTRFCFHGGIACTLPFAARLVAMLPGYLMYRRDTARLKAAAQRRSR